MVSPIASIGKTAERIPQPLVDKIPNERALKIRIFLDDIPVLVEIAFAVPHRVRIFTHDVGFAVSRSAVRLNGLDRGVHIALHVGDGVLPFIVHQA